MIVLVCSLSFLIAIILIMSDAKLLQEQYYSLKRLLILKNKTVLKNIKFNFLFMLVSFLIYFYYLKDLGLLLMLLSQYLFVTEFKLKDYHFTRRMIVLLLFSVVICLVLFSYVYFCIDYFLGVSLLFLLSFVSLILGLLMTAPIENAIGNYYIKLARDKVIKNKYIVIGITGSYGKTTMKNLLYSLLKTKYKISNQNHNYNTLLGLAKYINNEVKNNDDILIVELGVDQKNTMKKFKKLFDLDYALITSIGNMHLATFKTIENIKNEKLSIRQLLKENGVLFYNKDDVNLENSQNDFISSSINELSYIDDRPFSVIYKDKIITTSLYIKHQLSYLSMALKVVKYFDLNDEDILYGLNHLIVPSRRLNLINKGNDIYIDNSYNSNEKGFKESIDLLLKYDKYKIVITGGLIEIGNQYYEINYSIGQYMKDVDLVILISSDKSHPLKEGFISSSFNKIIILDDYTSIGNILENITQEKIILINSIGNKHFLN